MSQLPDQLTKCDEALVAACKILENFKAYDPNQIERIGAIFRNGVKFVDALGNVLTRGASSDPGHNKQRESILARDEDIELLLLGQDDVPMQVDSVVVNGHSSSINGFAKTNGHLPSVSGESGVGEGEGVDADIPLGRLRESQNIAKSDGKTNGHVIPSPTNSGIIPDKTSFSRDRDRRGEFTSASPPRRVRESTRSGDKTNGREVHASKSSSSALGQTSPSRDRHGRFKSPRRGRFNSTSSGPLEDERQVEHDKSVSSTLVKNGHTKKESVSAKKEEITATNQNPVTPSKPPTVVSASVVKAVESPEPDDEIERGEDKANSDSQEDSGDSDCLITAVEEAPPSAKGKSSKKKAKKSSKSRKSTVYVSGKMSAKKESTPFSSRFKRLISTSSDSDEATVVTALPLKGWKGSTKDRKLNQVAIVQVEKIPNLPADQNSFSYLELSKLGVNVGVKRSKPEKEQRARRTVRSGSDDEMRNLTRMPDLNRVVSPSGSVINARRSLRAVRRLSSSLSTKSNESSRRPSISDFEEEEDAACLRDDDSSCAKMSDDDNNDDDFDVDEEDEDDDDQEDDDFGDLEECSDPDFKPKGKSKKPAPKPPASASNSDVPSDVQRLLRKRVSVGSGLKKPDVVKEDSSSGSKSRSDESDEIVLCRRKSTRGAKSSNDDSGSDSESDDSDSSEPDQSDDSDFATTPSKKRALARKSSKKNDDDDDDDDDEGTSNRKKRVTRAASKKTPSRVVLLDEGTNPSDGSDSKVAKKRRRRIKKNNELELDTRRALKEETERQKRIEARQKLYNAALMSMGTATENKDAIILEVDSNNGKSLLQVNPQIASKLKKHQVEVVKFMWEACCESLDRLRNPSNPGSGCIVAHCMGLGKTLSVITFAHTLIANKDVTGVKNCLILSPLNTVLNWQQEFRRWVPEDDEIDVRELSSVKQMRARAAQVGGWHRDGGVLILGYEMYRRLTSDYKPNKLSPRKSNVFHEALISPGPDFVICDEGHILKSASSAISKLANLVKTKRRIVLTGTPLQNNLFEYHCMVSFVKPSLLGTREEFANRFANPIKAGESKDSTPADERLMKRRICVLHRLLQGCVHRRGYEHLTEVLPTKLEYVLLLRLTKIQSDLYVKYLTDIVGVNSTLKVTEQEATSFRRRLFADYHTLRYVATHPYLLLAAKIKRDEKEERAEMRDFLEDVDRNEASSSSGGDESEEEPEASSGSDDVEIIGENSSESDDVIIIGPNGEETIKPKSEPKAAASSSTSKTQQNSKKTKTTEKNEDLASIHEAARLDWFVSSVTEDMAKSIEVSSKFMVLMNLIRAFEEVGDKTLVFSQSLFFLDLFEEILHGEQLRRKAEKYESSDLLSTWEPDRDYFRIDGQVGASDRSDLIKRFNSPTNRRARLFLISTRAGGLGINLIGANRVIITDVSWNPSNDLQALFRAYRFGQQKPVYVYRLVAAGTMEERIYDRQVLKQSLSQRVVDEQQILRHFSTKDIAELYQFDLNDNVVTDPPSDAAESDETELLPLADADGSFGQGRESAPRPAQEPSASSFSRFVVPKDRIFAELLRKFPHVVKAYHDHDSLLAHQEDQVLDENERTAAWREYESEQKGIRVDSENPLLSHQQLTRAYQRDYRLSEDLAAFHALCYLREHFAPVRQVVREYCDQYMPHFEAKARESTENAKREQALQQQWNEMRQAALLANTAPGAVSVPSQEEFIRSFMQSAVQNVPPRPTFLSQSRQHHQMMAAIRQFAPYSGDVSNSAQPTPLPAGVSVPVAPPPQPSAASTLLSSLMQAAAQTQKTPTIARQVVPPGPKVPKQPQLQRPAVAGGPQQLAPVPTQMVRPQLPPQQQRPSQSQQLQARPVNRAQQQPPQPGPR